MFDHQFHKLLSHGQLVFPEVVLQFLRTTTYLDEYVAKLGITVESVGSNKIQIAFVLDPRHWYLWIYSLKCFGNCLFELVSFLRNKWIWRWPVEQESKWLITQLTRSFLFFIKFDYRVSKLYDALFKVCFCLFFNFEVSVVASLCWWWWF